MKFDFLPQKVVLAINAFILFAGSVGFCNSSITCTFPDDAKHLMEKMSIVISTGENGQVASVTTAGSPVDFKPLGFQSGSPNFTLVNFPVKGYSTFVNLNQMAEYGDTGEIGTYFMLTTPQGNRLPAKSLVCN